jgi:hypothetical protein
LWRTRSFRILRTPTVLLLLKNCHGVPPLALLRNSKAANLQTVQRLFSMFPAGAAGVALLILRLTSAAALLEAGWRQPLLTTLTGTFVILALPVGALCLGVLTPYTSTVSCLIELAIIVRSGTQPEFPIIISIVITAALGVLGPGAYSLDARIFGRKIIRFPTHDREI